MYLPCGGPCSCHSLRQASHQGDGDGGVVVDGGAAGVVVVVVVVVCVGGDGVVVVGGGGVFVVVVVVGGGGGVEIHFQKRFREGSMMCGGAAESAGTRLTLGNLLDGRNLKYSILLQDLKYCILLQNSNYCVYFSKIFAFGVTSGKFVEWLEVVFLFQVIHFFSFAGF